MSARVMRLLAVIGVLAVQLFCRGALADPGTAVRVGDHPGFGRVVFDMPEGASYNLVSEGHRLLVVFRGAGAVAEPGRLPRKCPGDADWVGFGNLAVAAWCACPAGEDGDSAGDRRA